LKFRADAWLPSLPQTTLSFENSLLIGPLPYHITMTKQIIWEFAWKFSFRKKNETIMREDVFSKIILTQLIDSY
jgi:hypothetical protein